MPFHIIDLLVFLMIVCLEVCLSELYRFFPSKRSATTTFAIEPSPPIIFHPGQALSSNHQRSAKYIRRKALHRNATPRRPLLKVSYHRFPPEVWATIMRYLDWKSLGRFDSAIDILKCLDSFRFFRSPALDQLPLHLLPLKWVKNRGIRLYKLQSVLLPIDGDLFDDGFLSSVPRSTVIALRSIDLSKLTTIDIYTDRNTPGLLSSISKSKPALLSCKFYHSSELDQDYFSHDLGNGLLSLLASSAQSLRSLSFNNSDIGPGGRTDGSIDGNKSNVMKSIAQCHGLSSLSIVECSYVFDRDLVHVVEGCRLLTHITISKVNWTHSASGESPYGIKNAGLAAIGRCCPNLVHLDVSCMGEDHLDSEAGNFSDDGLAHIARGCPALVTIVLDYCTCFSDRGVYAMVIGLRKLRHVSLQRCHQLTKRSLNHVTEHLRELESLNLVGWRVGRRGVQGVWSLIERCQCLRELKIDGWVTKRMQLPVSSLSYTHVMYRQRRTIEMTIESKEEDDDLKYDVIKLQHIYPSFMGGSEGMTMISQDLPSPSSTTIFHFAPSSPLHFIS